MEKKHVKVGLAGVGLNTYWQQFDGLLSRLLGYQEEICRKMTEIHRKCTESFLN